jgi:hypothetical protein
MLRFLSLLVLLLGSAGSVNAQSVNLQAVSVALVFAMDVSGSVNNERYEMQRDGTALAVSDPQVMRAIQSNPSGAIAVAVVEWSDSSAVTVPWTLVTSPAEAQAVAAAIRETRRTSAGSTAIGNALLYSAKVMDACPFATERRVIDVSGDGKRNAGVSMEQARSTVERAGIIVNGLPILALERDLEDWYQQEVMIGEGSFVIAAQGWEDFQHAMLAKLIAELW